ncbi:MAG: NAD(P)-dependent oxidoreductase [Methylobacter sp.]|nr:NAD(P)-dependent oxidoreductase [Methylobacter sp.]
MNILITGSTGFIGANLVPLLLAHRHTVTALVRNAERAADMPWANQVRFIVWDIGQDIAPVLEKIGAPDAVIHLAWAGLPNYKALFHFEQNLPAHYRFLKSLVEQGVGQVLVTGTCFEYGMQNGCLSEQMPAQPENSYALAKDTLRRFLQALQQEHNFTLQWARLFYIYGPGQSSNSLLAQLDRALNNGEKSFNMSNGEQLRDYLAVEEVARRLLLLLEHSECNGLVNVCSGEPISVRRLVEHHIQKRGASIALNFGYYPYPDYEPMAFWGDHRRIAQLENSI